MIDGGAILLAALLILLTRHLEPKQLHPYDHTRLAHDPYATEDQSPNLKRDQATR